MIIPSIEVILIMNNLKTARNRKWSRGRQHTVSFPPTMVLADPDAIIDYQLRRLGALQRWYKVCKARTGSS